MRMTGWPLGTWGAALPFHLHHSQPCLTVLMLRSAETLSTSCRPDIVHAHDWPTAPVAFGDLGGRCRSIFTIHNLNYGADLIGRAMLAAAAGTTVSPTYAAEVRLSAFVLA